MNLAKIDAAVRQLDTAIQLFFEQRDPVAVCTLTCAAGRILSDLVEHKRPGDSWRMNAVKLMPMLKPAEVFAIIDQTPNFLKHADRDPDGVEHFAEEENDDRLFMACLECGEVGHPLTVEMQVFEIWYMASHPERFPRNNKPAQDAISILPSLTKSPRADRIAIGANLLAEQKKQAGVGL